MELEYAQFRTAMKLFNNMGVEFVGGPGNAHAKNPDLVAYARTDANGNLLGVDVYLRTLEYQQPNNSGHAKHRGPADKSKGSHFVPVSSLVNVKLAPSEADKAKAK